MRRVLAGAAMVLALALVASILTVTLRLTRAVPPAVVSVHARGSAQLAEGTVHAIPLPAVGSLALTSDHDGPLAALADTTVRAIGSVAKTMTALQVLTDRPLAAGSDGPDYVITGADVAILKATVQANGSFAPVTVGEHFSERQLLLGLMLPSANNLAETLAVWDGGTRDAFITLLNAHAVALGMLATHFADPSGYSNATVSTAHDLLLLGGAALANPALAAIVATPDASLPDGTPIHNLDEPLGTAPGWLGIKTGETPAAGGCLLFAARHSFADGAGVTVVGAVLGQPHLAEALSVAVSAAAAGLDRDVEVQPGALDPQATGSVEAAWGAGSAVRTEPGAGGGATSLVVRRDGTAQFRVEAETLGDPALPAGTTVARIVATIEGHDVATWSVITTAGIEGPSLWWRLRH